MADTTKTKVERVRQRNLVKLPEAFLEECGLGKGSQIDVRWGKNYSCVIITMTQAELSTNQKERIRILTTESLDGR